jgi:heat-inducible transcriptional repressor
MNIDDHHIPELTERQLHILSALIKAYTDKPEPVSSKQLVDEYELNVSSATVRNELSVLEQLGLIRAPHTSSGRVPTEEGYRYFVRHNLTFSGLTRPEMNSIRTELKTASQDVQNLMRTAASILARQTEGAAIVTEPRGKTMRFRHLQLIHTYGQAVLMVMVLEGGDIMQQMLTLAEPVQQEHLTRVALMLNDHLKGENASRIRTRARHFEDPLAQDVMELVADVLSAAEISRTFVVHSYGFGDILHQFEEQVGAQQALRLLDENQLLDSVLSEVINREDNAVQVIVGGDGRQEFNRLSMVIGRYGTNQLVGALTVLGPTRMRYGRVISTVRYVSTLMSDMMNDVYGVE